MWYRSAASHITTGTDVDRIVVKYGADYISYDYEKDISKKYFNQLFKDEFFVPSIDSVVCRVVPERPTHDNYKALFCQSTWNLLHHPFTKDYLDTINYVVACT